MMSLNTVRNALAFGVLISVGLTAERKTAFADATQPVAIARLEDPRYDDHGAGDYVYPSAEWYKRGQFDLRTFEVLSKNGIVTFRVTLDHPVRRPNRVMTAQNQGLDLQNGIYFQNIDIYIDHTRGQGETQGIPGRNVRFSRREGWDFAVVITPQPYAVRSILSEWPPHTKVIVPDTVRSHGRQIWVEIPEIALGAPLGPDTGYQVTVSGALFQNNFEVFRWATGRLIKNAFTMPVFSVPEQMAFGGGVLSRWQPRTVDILVPDRKTQSSYLRKFVHDTKTVAAVPMVYPSGRTPSTESSTVADLPGLPSAGFGPPVDEVRSDGAIIASIRDVHDQIAILKRPAADLPLYRLGVVLDDTGTQVGRVVVTAIFSEFIQTTIVEGQGKVRPGHEVRFDARRSK